MCSCQEAPPNESWENLKKDGELSLKADVHRGDVFKKRPWSKTNLVLTLIFIYSHRGLCYFILL